MTADEIVICLAKSDPIGIIDMDDAWSEWTPATRMNGCIHCKSSHAYYNVGHEYSCVWMMAYEYWQVKIANGDIV